MKIGSLFSGIGGFDLAARWIGWETKWYSEIDPYAIRVMERRFPGAYNVGDVTEFLADSQSDDEQRHRQALVTPGTRGRRGTKAPGGRSCADAIDILCGGFPCQPVSCAGKRLGQDDPRWLWPHFARIIRVLRPRYVVAENVPGLLGRGATDVLRDFAALGYDVEWETIPASAVGAPHKRDRVWFLAYPASDDRWNDRLEETGGPSPTRRDQRARGGCLQTRVVGGGGRSTETVADQPGLPDTPAQREEPRILGADGTVREGTRDHTGNEVGRSDVADASGGRYGSSQREVQTGRHGTIDGDWWSTEPDVGRVASRVSSRVDRLRCLGNAIVPQIAYWIFQQIEAREAANAV